MPRRDIALTERQERLIQNREVEEAAKLEGLRAAALVGVSAFDRGAFKEFADAPALRAHLQSLGDLAAPGSQKK